MIKLPLRSITSIALLWAVCMVRLAKCFFRDTASTSRLIERAAGTTKIAGFVDLSTAKLASKIVNLVNGDFDSCNITGGAGATLAVDNTATAIPNWSSGGSGVQILSSSTYQMSSYSRSAYAIHLNNPASTFNGTQGSLTTTLAANPALGEWYTVQFDSARNPDGPINLYPVLKIAIMQSINLPTMWAFREPIYNTTDTRQQITWARYSMIYIGLGVATQIRFESMTEKYGAIVDNVVILAGKHPLSTSHSTDPCGPLLGSFAAAMAISIAIAFH